MSVLKIYSFSLTPHYRLTGKMNLLVSNNRCLNRDMSKVRINVSNEINLSLHFITSLPIERNGSRHFCSENC